MLERKGTNFGYNTEFWEPPTASERTSSPGAPVITCGSRYRRVGWKSTISPNAYGARERNSFQATRLFGTSSMQPVQSGGRAMSQRWPNGKTRVSRSTGASPGQKEIQSALWLNSPSTSRRAGIRRSNSELERIECDRRATLRRSPSRTACSFLPREDLRSCVIFRLDRLRGRGERHVLTQFVPARMSARPPSVALG